VKRKLLRQIDTAGLFVHPRSRGRSREEREIQKLIIGERAYDTTAVSGGANRQNPSKPIRARNWQIRR